MSLRLTAPSPAPCAQIQPKPRTFSGRALRGKQLEGLKFRRQVPLDGYIVDFVCFEARLIIEVDGGQHSESQRDKVRDLHFERQGFATIRVWNDEVLTNIDSICLTILREAQRRLREK
jgi:very-short-patch-repair endonuclease